jgi:ABC-type amino acid transport substrate-binding protein
MPQLRALAIGLALAGVAAGASAECRRSGDAEVAIGVRDAPPFITADPVRGQRGLTFELWTSIERELRADGRIGRTEFVDCPLGAQLEALAAGELDLVISPLTITAERMERIDFTHQYLSSGITVAQRASSAIDFRYAAGILRDTLTHRGVPRAILIFLAANLVLAAVTARMLRQQSDYGVIASEPMPLRLCRFTLETVVRTIGLKGIGDGVRSTAVRTLEVVMAVVGTVLSAVVFGVLTSALVGSIGGNREIALADLPTLRIATLRDSTSQVFLEQLGSGADAVGADARLQPISTAAAGPSPCMPLDRADAAARCVTTASWGEAMQALARGEVDAVLGDWAQLTYLARSELDGKVTVQQSAFRLEPYGWGVSPRRPELRAAIDRALMARVRSPGWRFVVEEYMGSGSISPD